MQTKITKKSEYYYFSQLYYSKSQSISTLEIHAYKNRTPKIRLVILLIYIKVKPCQLEVYKDENKCQESNKKKKVNVDLLIYINMKVHWLGHHRDEHKCKELAQQTDRTKN